MTEGGTDKEIHFVRGTEYPPFLPPASSLQPNAFLSDRLIEIPQLELREFLLQ
jgi:hypothetical protein